MPDLGGDKIVHNAYGGAVTTQAGNVKVAAL